MKHLGMRFRPSCLMAFAAASVTLLPCSGWSQTQNRPAPIFITELNSIKQYLHWPISGRVTTLNGDPLRGVGLFLNKHNGAGALVPFHKAVVADPGCTECQALLSLAELEARSWASNRCRLGDAAEAITSGKATTKRPYFPPPPFPATSGVPRRIFLA